MRRTTTAGLVAGLILAAAPVSAEVAAASPATAASAKHGWSTLLKKAGAKVQACQHDRAGFHGVEVRLNARKATRRVKARSRIEHLEDGVWLRVGRSSPWRRHGAVFFDSFISGMDYPLRVQVKLKTTACTSPYTGWVDPATLKHCR